MRRRSRSAPSRFKQILSWEIIMKMVQHIFAGLGLAVACFGQSAAAQDTVRIRGTIEGVDGPVYVIKNRDGAELKLTMTDKPLYVAIVKSTMGDIKPGMFVGASGMTQPDG